MLERLKNTFDKSLAAVSARSESLVESSRIRTAINTSQKAMEDGIRALGGSFYNSWCSGCVNVEALMTECERIHGISEEIESLKLRLEKLKAEESQILGGQQKAAEAGKPLFCSECGKKLESDARFCDGCGTPVNQ